MRQTIATKRLLLRRHRRDDTARIAALVGDWDVARMLAAPPYPYTTADAERFLTAVETALWEFAVEAGGHLVGVIGITDRLGYWLGRPFWGQGYATEAAAALVDAYFADTGANCIVSGHFVDNGASRHVLRKLGFRVTGESRMFCAARGAHLAHVDMRLDRARWAADRAGTLDAALAARD